MRFIYTYRNSRNESETIDLRRCKARIFVARPIGRVNPGIARRYPGPIVFRASDGRWFLSENPRKGDATQLDPDDIMRWFYLLEASALNIREMDDNALDLARSKLAAIIEPEQPEILIKEANRVIARSKFLYSGRSQDGVILTLKQLIKSASELNALNNDVRVIRLPYKINDDKVTVGSIGTAARQEFASVITFEPISRNDDYLYLVVRTNNDYLSFVVINLIKMAKDVMANLEIAGLVDVSEEPLRATSEQRDREMVRRFFGWVFEVSEIRATGVRPRVRSVIFEWAGEDGWLSAEELDHPLFESVQRAAAVVIQDINEDTDFDNMPLVSPTKFEPMWSDPTIQYWAELNGLRASGGDSLNFLYGELYYDECKNRDSDFEEEHYEPTPLEAASQERTSLKVDHQEPLVISSTNQAQPFTPSSLVSSEVLPDLPVEQRASNDTRTSSSSNGEPTPSKDESTKLSNSSNPERDAQIVTDYRSGCTYEQIRDHLKACGQDALSDQAIYALLRRRAGPEWPAWKAEHKANAKATSQNRK